MPVRITNRYESCLGDQDKITVGLVNNMPDGAIRSTEQQFVRLLGEASDGINVDLTLFSISDVPRSEQAKAQLLRGYSEISELWDSRVDALIVTGNEPRAPTLPQEPYWPMLTRVIDWAEENTVSSIWACLAAHAAVLYLDGIGRHAFDAKLSGVFDCVKTGDHDILNGAAGHWSVPHSRQYGLRREELEAKGYRALTISSQAGVDIFLKQRRSLFIFFQGHLEYDSYSLFKEYVRDIGRYLSGERETYPDAPHGYFEPVTAAAFAQFRERALANRSPDLMSSLPLREADKLVNTWHSTATSIYRGWLRWMVERKAGRAPSTDSLTSASPALESPSS
jgi:homoserine O-succinyltransferase/O-acetyltransferase